jgi:hypothetical protein
MQIRKAAAALCAMCLAGAAYAQYIWLDEKGVKQFSDMPPPPSVPASRILKQPDPSAKPQPAAAASPGKEGAAGAPAEAAKPAPTLAERNAEFLKRRQEQADKAKKDEEEAKRQADKQANCERARTANRVIESGQPIFTAAPGGGRHYLTPGERMKQLEDNKKTLDGC